MIPHLTDEGRSALISCCVCGEQGLDRFNLLEDEYAHGDHNAVTTFEDRDYDYPESLNPLRTRGGFTVIGLICPMGHVQQLVIGNHKGAEYIGLFPGGAK